MEKILYLLRLEHSLQLLYPQCGLRVGESGNSKRATKKQMQW